MALPPFWYAKNPKKFRGLSPRTPAPEPPQLPRRRSAPPHSRPSTTNYILATPGCTTPPTSFASGCMSMPSVAYLLIWLAMPANRGYFTENTKAWLVLPTSWGVETLVRLVVANVLNRHHSWPLPRGCPGRNARQPKGRADRGPGRQQGVAGNRTPGGRRLRLQTPAESKITRCMDWVDVMSTV